MISRTAVPCDETANVVDACISGLPVNVAFPSQDPARVFNVSIAVAVSADATATFAAFAGIVLELASPAVLERSCGVAAVFVVELPMETQADMDTQTIGINASAILCMGVGVKELLLRE